VGSGGFQFVELAADARVNLVVSTLVVAQPHGHAPLDVAGGQEDDATFVLQAVVKVNEIMKDALGQFVGFVEKQIALSQIAMNYIEGPGCGPPLVLIPAQMGTWRSYYKVLPVVETC